MGNPYAPPAALVEDIADHTAAATPADRGTRLGAALLDMVIVIVMIYIPVLLFITVAMFPRRAGVFGLVAVVVGLVGFVAWIWATVKYVLRNGQTIGKKLLRIKVARSDGTRASFARIFWLRNVVNVLVSVVPLYWVIDHLFVFGDSRQCLHDKLADTIVINA
jgi:uncharacterized RDD family membrane protein YckC